MDIWQEDGPDNSYWFGPVLKCKFEKWFTERRRGHDSHRCSNEDCFGFNSYGSCSAEFCGHCGSKIEVTENYYDEPIKPDKELPLLVKGLELKQLDKEDLEYTILGDGTWGDCNRYSINKELPPALIQREIDEFRKKYFDYIGECVKIFGKENVRITWGIFSYYHDY